MFILFLFLAASHHCLHDKLHNRRILEQDIINYSISTNWNNIRVKFNFEYLMGRKNDSKMCLFTNQNISWNSENYTCEMFDILNEYNKDSLIKTLENAKHYIEGIFKVRPVENYNFSLIGYDSVFDDPPESYSSNCDLHITVVSRPFESYSTVAMAAILQRNNKDFRPIQGALIINPRMVPSIPQNESSTENYFFKSLIHEIFHIFGFSASNYKYFHSLNDFDPYSNVFCNLTSKGKNFTFLITPYAHKYAKKHFKTNYFMGDNNTRCLSGIELEDGGKSGTAMSHLEMRTYLTDIMAPHISYLEGEFNVFSDASMAVLLDTGNYKIDFKKVKPMLWGNIDLHKNEVFNASSFAIGPPQLVFPDLYLASSQNDKIGFDYTFYSRDLSIDESELDEESKEKYIKGKNFYNPKNFKNIGSNDVIDFSNIKSPSFICNHGLAAINGIENCVLYEIINNSKIRFSWDNYSLVCNESMSNTIHKIGNYEIVCPVFERFIRAKALHNSFFSSDPFDGDDFKYSDPYFANNDQKTVFNSKEKLIILGIVLSIVFICFIVSVILIFIFYQINMHNKRVPQRNNVESDNSFVNL